MLDRYVLVDTICVTLIFLIFRMLSLTYLSFINTALSDLNDQQRYINHTTYDSPFYLILHSYEYSSQLCIIGTGHRGLLNNGRWVMVIVLHYNGNTELKL